MKSGSCSVLVSALAVITTVVLFTGTAQAQTLGPNVYFDPSNSRTTTSGGSGDFSTSNFWNGSTDAPLVSGTNMPGTFVPGDSAIFNGAANTVTVASAVNPDSVEVNVGSGTETFGTALGGESTISLPVGWNPTTGPNFLNPITIDAGSENVVFNSNVNFGIMNHYYGPAFLNSASTGSVTFNGGISFTNNTTDGDNIGQPDITFAPSAGGTFTINSAVTYSEAVGSSPLTNSDNTPYVYLDTPGSTLTLTPNASFSDVKVRVDAGTVLDQGASISSPVYGTNYQIVVGGTGQYLTDTPGMTVTPNIVFSNGGGTIGGALAAETTFSSNETVSYNGTTLNLTSAAGGRVNFTGDVHSGQGNAVVKVGAGTVDMDDTGSRGEDQTGAWEIQNGTMLLNGTIAHGSNITGSMLTIDAVAPGAISSTQTYAILGGIGSTNVPIVAAGGTSVIAPGDPEVSGGIGTLTLNGGVSAPTGLTLAFNLNGASTSSLNLGAGAFSLSGPITVDFTDIGSDSVLPGTNYILATGSGAWSDSGATFTFGRPDGLFLQSYSFNTGTDVFEVEFKTAPEPGTWALMGLGLLALIWRMRRKNATV
jgi:hypothetical protein